MTEPQEKIVSHRALETAEDLFHELSPATGDLWRVADYIENVDNRLGEWLFRGQSNDADGRPWALRPSAHRAPNAIHPSLPAPTEILRKGAMPHLNEAARRFMEWGLVHTFAQIVDDHGLVVPGDNHVSRDGRMRATNLELDSTIFPPPSEVALFGLAQHHGIPTRLLDWTRKPFVGAYFAAQPIAQRRAFGKQPPETECPYFSIFAVRRLVVEACEALDPEIHFLTVPSATNSNLHAQGGVFSLVQPLSELGDPLLPAIDEVPIKHADRIWGRDNGRYQSFFPLLVEFRIQVREARVVMHTLRNMGVTAASIYPGLDGVVRSIKERQLCIWQKRGERS